MEIKTSMQGKSHSDATVDTDVIIEFAERKHQIREAELKVKRAAAKLRDDEAGILAMLSHAGVPRITVDTKYGSRTIGFIRNVFSSKKKGVSTEEVVAVLDELDLGDFHKESITLQSVNAWLREQHEEGNEIPEPLTAVLNTEPSYRVGVTKS